MLERTYGKMLMTTHSHESDEGSVTAQVAPAEEVSRLNEQISKQAKDITELKQHAAQLEEELEKSGSAQNHESGLQPFPRPYKSGRGKKQR